MNPNVNVSKVALYCRVSLRDGRQDTENQLAQLKAHCDARGWTITNVYEDQESGGKSARPGLQTMLQDARARKFDLLLFWSLDRLSREGVLETLHHLQRLTDAGVEWCSLTEQYLDSTGIFRDAVIGILATIAKQERIRRSERTKAGLERVVREGRGDSIGRPPALTPAKLQTVRNLRGAGQSIRKIAAHVRVSPATVLKALQVA